MVRVRSAAFLFCHCLITVLVVVMFDRNLYNRIFEFTNKHTGYGLELPGQEGFTIIQYNKEDEYQ